MSFNDPLSTVIDSQIDNHAHAVITNALKQTRAQVIQLYTDALVGIAGVEGNVNVDDTIAYRATLLQSAVFDYAKIGLVDNMRAAVAGRLIDFDLVETQP